jgi:glycosyltransferase involved in cell wall biosynthesis
MISRLCDKWNIQLCVVTKQFGRDVENAGAAVDYCASVSIFEAEDPEKLPLDLPARVRTNFNLAVRHHLEAQLEAAYGLVHVQGYFLAGMLPRQGARVFLMTENIEYDLARQREQFSQTNDAPWQVSREMERSAWLRAEIIGTATATDADSIAADIGRERDLVVVPAGVDHFDATDDDGGVAQRVQARGPFVLYTANFDWEPSADGALYLLSQVWPQVRERVPGALLVLAGAGSTTGIAAEAARDPSVVITGTVPSLAPLLRAATVFACAVRYGGGVKSKLLESLDAGCATVTTSAGAQGLDAPLRAAAWILDDTEAFVSALVETLHDPCVREDLRAGARAVRPLLPRWEQGAVQLHDGWLRMAAENSSPRMQPSKGQQTCLQSFRRTMSGTRSKKS